MIEPHLKSRYLHERHLAALVATKLIKYHESSFDSSRLCMLMFELSSVVHSLVCVSRKQTSEGTTFDTHETIFNDDVSPQKNHKVQYLDEDNGIRPSSSAGRVDFVVELSELYVEAE